MSTRDRYRLLGASALFLVGLILVTVIPRAVAHWGVNWTMALTFALLAFINVALGVGIIYAISKSYLTEETTDDAT